MMNKRRTIDPVNYPITIRDCRDWLNITHTEDDQLLHRLIQSVTTDFENFCGRSLITQTWQLTLDCFPNGQSTFGNILNLYPRNYNRNYDYQYENENCISLRRGPLLNIVSFTYIDEDNVEHIFDTAQIYIDENEIDPAINLLNDFEWPDDELRGVDSIKIVYEAGFGPDDKDIPAGIRQSLLALLSHRYECREDVTMLPEDIKRIWQQYRQRRIV